MKSVGELGEGKGRTSSGTASNGEKNVLSWRN